MMFSYNSHVAGRLRLMVMVLAIGALLATSGCSWFRKKKSMETATPSVLANDGVQQGAGEPASPDRMHGSLGEPVPFPAGAMDVVYFDFDQSNPRHDSARHLDKDVEYLKENSGDKVYIEGHCDERGTVEYNFSLGQRRALSVQEYFINHGIAADRIVTASKGKEEPADPGHDERAFAKNRRCEFKQVK